MRIKVIQGDVLAEQADGLVCSANVFLNLSGGVGGEILRRHGMDMQNALHECLHRRGLKFVQQGDVIETRGCGTAFSYVFHAVAVDAWYKSSSSVVEALFDKVFERSETLKLSRIAAVAVGTGFGRLPVNEFCKGLLASLDTEYHGISELVLSIPSAHDVAIARQLLAAGANVRSE